MFNWKKNILLLGIILTLFPLVSSAATLSNVRVLAIPGTVALTFDDGPSPVFTPQILDILKANNIKATFFVMGPLAKRFPDIIHRMIAEGHAVGVHTMTHPRLTRLNDAQLNYEVVGSRDIVQKIIGNAPVCLRPPYEVINNHVRHFVEAHNLIVVPMAYDSFDYTHRSADRVVKGVVDHVKSERVFLFHDGYAHRGKTVAAIPKIIAGIRAKGFGFSAICYPLNN